MRTYKRNRRISNKIINYMNERRSPASGHLIAAIKQQRSGEEEPNIKIYFVIAGFYRCNLFVALCAIAAERLEMGERADRRRSRETFVV